MTDRKYSVAEIDRMRAAVECKWLFGCWPNEMKSTTTFARTWTDKGKTAAVEEMLRTYMLAGIGPEELE